MRKSRQEPEPCTLTCNEDGRVIAMSAEFARMFCGDPNALIGSYPPFPWWPPDRQDVFLQLFRLALSELGEAFSGMAMRLDVRTRSGSNIPILCYCERLENGATVFVHKPEYGDAAVAELVEKAVEIGELTRRFEVRVDASMLKERLERLSPRESTVLGLLLHGHRAAQIADELHISVHTVRNHRKAIFEKLEVSSQVELMAKLGDQGER